MFMHIFVILRWIDRANRAHGTNRRYGAEEGVPELKLCRRRVRDQRR